MSFVWVLFVHTVTLVTPSVPVCFAPQPESIPAHIAASAAAAVIFLVIFFILPVLSAALLSAQIYLMIKMSTAFE